MTYLHLRHQLHKTLRQRDAKLFKCMSTVSNFSRRNLPVWTDSLSFASPESDFVSAHGKTVSHFSSSASDPAWSKTLSFASPESDFVSASKLEHNAHSYSTKSNEKNWSETISFASPESDFVSASSEAIDISTTVAKEQWSESLSFASPESDFVSASESEHLASSSANNRSDIHSSLEILFDDHLLYPSPETATGFLAYSEMVDEKMLESVLQRQYLKESIPKTIKDALNDQRPIVITTNESPFRVVDVNSAWEGLCGYHREEAIGRNLGSLLQGPDTNIAVANELVRSLKQNGISETVITNYAKNGRRFENHIQIGKVTAVDDSDVASSHDAYFVGVLRDISVNSSQKVGAM